MTQKELLEEIMQHCVTSMFSKSYLGIDREYFESLLQEHGIEKSAYKYQTFGH